MIDDIVRERKTDGGAVIPVVPLVVEVRAEEISGLAVHDVQRAVVEIGEVDSEAFGRSEIAARLLDGGAVSGQRLNSGTAPATDERNAAEERMLNVDGVNLAPRPSREIGGNFLRVQRGVERGCEEFIVIGEIRRQPVLGLMSERAFDPGRRDEPMIFTPAVANLRIGGGSSRV